MKNNIKTNLNTEFLKLIAIITMLLDHIGKILYPNLQILQIIGRIAFPIFSYTLVIGFLYTSNLKKYMTRLLIFGLVSQPIYILAFNRTWYNLNIFFTLFLGLIALYLIREKKYIPLSLLIISCLFIPISYGLPGILLIICFYIFREDKIKSLIISSFLLLFIFPQFYPTKIALNNILVPKQSFAALSLIFIYIQTNIKLHINKYFFYLFYPIHLLILFLLRI